MTTIYVGASADLVRGFITPLERAIAAADGIDYLQSQSAQGVSTITARLKLNYDGNKALSDISTKVDAERNNLPPESEVPVIKLEPADSQFASAYLSFTSDVLQPNEVTDYLVRIVQPRLSAISGVQRAEILGGRTFAMRVWLKPDRMAALNISPADVRTALENNNFLSAVGNSKGALISTTLTINTDLHNADEFRRLVVREKGGQLIRLGDIADVVLGAEDYDTEARLSQKQAVVMGSGVWTNRLTIPEVMRSAGSVTENVPRLSWRFSRTLRSETKSFNLPKPCWSTMSTFRYGVRITSRWSSGWSALNAVPAARKVSAICRLLSTRSFSRNSGKRAHISIQNTATLVVPLPVWEPNRTKLPLRSRKRSRLCLTWSPRVNECRPTNAGERPGPK